MWNLDLTISCEAVGTTEPVNAEEKILLKTNPNDSLGGMAEQTGDNSERSSTNPTTKLDYRLDIERVNIRPRKLYFIGLLHFTF